MVGVQVSAQLTPGLTEIQGDLLISNTLELKGSDVGPIFKDLSRIVGSVTITGNENAAFSLNGTLDDSASAPSHHIFLL